MSAILCGKRSFFEEAESGAPSPTSASPPVYKKLRCSSSNSPVRFTYSPPAYSGPVDQLKALFPDMEIQLLEKALEDSGNDLNSAINSLNELQLGYLKSNSGLAAEENPDMEKETAPGFVDAVPSEEPQIQNKMPTNGAEWVDLVVKEMMSATSIDDARSRAARVLESLEKSITSQASARLAEGFHKVSNPRGAMPPYHFSKNFYCFLEKIRKIWIGGIVVEREVLNILIKIYNFLIDMLTEESHTMFCVCNFMFLFLQEHAMLKEQIEALLGNNAILKRAVAIQHERQKEYDESNQEVQQLKQLVAQYQEQLRTLEMNNYALTLHLRQAQQSNSSVIGRFNPDVF
ncbi:hypothetical protein MIMGU_mgv1a009334mg [Erythranthe guttata]|uniref:CUE domain-containing protein n=1 Tax=Erythranthe guttata TaxID=4155 RepID=A0A022Q9K8_ERYGU|nr:hypothetical protein MIMGU_mgv1a009334mg [Erythranthe guttata]